MTTVQGPTVGVCVGIGSNFGKMEPMSPLLPESVPSTPPSDHDVSNKSVSESSEEVMETTTLPSPEKKFSGTCSPPNSTTNHFRSWNVSPVKRPNISSSVSPTPSRISSQGSAGTPDNLKTCAADPVLPFPESAISPESFKMSPPFVSDHFNPYFRLNNPFQMAQGLLGNPFLAPSNFGLISQQIHPAVVGVQKDVSSMTMQQLQFLQNRLQCLPSQTGLNCAPLPTSKAMFHDSKAQLSLLIQARKNPKPDNETSFRPLSTKSPYQSFELLKAKHSRRSSVDDSDSDELLSVGSESPPLTFSNSRRDTDNDNESDAGSSSMDCSSTLFPKSPFQAKPRSPKTFPTVNKSQNKTGNSNRTLKFSIDNILKSDFGAENVPIVRKSSKSDVKKCEKDVDRKGSTPKEVKKSEPEKEGAAPMDLTNETTTATTTTSNSTTAVNSSETPMLWPAWVYCTRYSDRPSSGRTFYITLQSRCK